ncbi:hypothetical protein HYW18_00165 [Candidatus Uhrbacteria bacterium]|nr:hypothetical protein [Candidatus Uhrbacteria bacterium]
MLTLWYWYAGFWMAGFDILEYSHTNKMLWLGWCSFAWAHWAIPGAIARWLASALHAEGIARGLDRSAHPVLVAYALTVLVGWHWWVWVIGILGIVGAVLTAQAMRRAGRVHGAGARALQAARHGTGHGHDNHDANHGPAAGGGHGH